MPPTGAGARRLWGGSGAQQALEQPASGSRCDRRCGGRLPPVQQGSGGGRAWLLRGASWARPARRPAKLRAGSASGGARKSTMAGKACRRCCYGRRNTSVQLRCGGHGPYRGSGARGVVSLALLPLPLLVLTGRRHCHQVQVRQEDRGAVSAKSPAAAGAASWPRPHGERVHHARHGCHRDQRSRRGPRSGRCWAVAAPPVLRR